MNPSDVTIVVATYGDEATWRPLAERALASTAGQGAARVAWHHSAAGNLSDARNEAVRAEAHTPWLCMLDADDELEAGYLDGMSSGAADLRAPWVRWVRGHRAIRGPEIPAGSDDLAVGSRLVIGTLLPTELFWQVGGFRPWPFFEDWCLWQRCWLAGATVEFIDRAVYRAHVRQGSRNRAPSQTEKRRVHDEIRRANMPWLFTKAPA